MYDTKSFQDKGTLCHLRNMIDRRNISATAADDYNACEEFFIAVVESHIVTAAMTILDMNCNDDIPVHPLLTEDFWAKPAEIRKKLLMKLRSSSVYLLWILLLTMTRKMMLMVMM